MTTTTNTSPGRRRIDDDADRTLERLLAAELDYSPLARNGFISHLAMSLVAARRIGASATELQAWFDDQTSGDFLRARARPARLDEDSERIRRRGIDAEVAERLPALIDGPSSQFFHAVIRLELAIDAGDPAQVANALDNWEADHPAIGPEPSGTGDDSFEQLLERLAGHPEASGAASWDLDGAAGADWFTEAMDHLEVGPDLLDQVAASVVTRHTDPHHFGTLHLVTGTRALRAVSRHLGDDDRRRLAARSAQAVAAALTSFGLLAPTRPGTIERWREEAPDDWRPIARAAIDSGDPHVAKVVYACQLEESATGDPLYRTIALRQTGG